MNDELWFTVLGPSGCGKTTLLACMNEYFGKLLQGAFETGDADTFIKLGDAYKKLQKEAEDTSKNIIFSGGIKGTDAEKQYPFVLKGKRRNVAIRFFDFPGDWLNPRDSKQSFHYESIEKKTQRSSVIIAVIDAPYLMHYNGKFQNKAGIDEIEYAIENSLSQHGEDKLLLLVPVKCEKYLANDKDAGELLRTIKKAFSHTISLADSDSPYYGKLAVAILPVKTMGNVLLSRFEIRDNEPVLHYRRITGSRFMPENADQPLRYAMSFLLEQYKKISSRSKLRAILDSIFGNENLDKVLATIRMDIKTDIKGSEIIYGRELLGLDK